MNPPLFCVPYGTRKWDGALITILTALALALFHVPSHAAESANDAFASRRVLAGTEPTDTASITGATHEANEPNPHNLSPGASLWWEWTAPLGGPVALEAWGETVVPKVSVFTGTAFPDLELVAKGYGGVSGTEFGFHADEDRTYFIALDASGTPSGQVTLELRPGPANDDFAQRTPLVGAVIDAESTFYGGTREPGEPTHGSLTQTATLWWEWTAPAAGSVSVHAESLYATTTVAVYTGDTLATLAPVASDTDGDGWSAQVSLRAVPGQVFQIAVASPFSGDSPVTLQIRPGPPNDDFAQRTRLDPGPVSLEGATLGALVEEAEPAFGMSPFKHTVWYEWMTDRSGGWELRLAGVASEASAVLAQGDALSNLVARAWVTAAREATGSMVFRATAAERFLLQVNGQVDGGAPFLVEMIPGPDNDDFAQRQVLPPIGPGTPSTTVGATREADEPRYNGALIGRTVWWGWTAPATGGYYVETEDPEETPFLGVYRGESVDQLTPVAADTVWVPQPLLRRSFHALAGESFAFVIADASALGRPVSLTLFAGPVNDDFAQAVRLDGLSGPFLGNTRGATTEPGQPPLPQGMANPVWFRWHAPAQAGVGVRVSGQDGTAGVVVFRGDTLEDLREVARGEWRFGESVTGFHTDAGVDFAIAVTGPESYALELLPAAVNDDFATRTELAGDTATNTVAVFLASREVGEPVVGSLTNASSLWWRWRAPATQGYEVEVHHAYAHGALAVFTGITLDQLALAAPPLEEIDSLTRLQFHATAGVDYAFGFWLAAGSDGLTLALRPCPPNDHFAHRVRLEGATVTHAMTFHGASREPGEPPLPDARNAGTVWYEWTAPDTRSYLIRGDYAASTDLALLVWRGVDWPPTDLVDWAPASAWDHRVRLGLAAVAGTTYCIAAAAGSQDSDTTLAVQIQPGPVNDDFAGRELLTGEMIVLAGTTVGATREQDEPAHGGRANGASVWYRWVAPRDGPFVVSVLGSTPRVARVFTGESLASLDAIGSASSTRVPFNAVAGVEYPIAVDSADDVMNAFTLRLSPPPPNDAFANRTVLIGTHLTATSYTLHATPEPLEWTASGGANSVWWTWAPPTDGLARFTLRTAEAVGPALAAFTEVPGHPYSNVVDVTSLRATNCLASTVPVHAGRIYDFRASTLWADSTNLALTLELEPRPPLAIDWMSQGHDWLLGGQDGWCAQTNVVHTGPDALQSGPIPSPGTGLRWLPASSSAESWLQAAFAGPGILTFWWKVSSGGRDVLSFETLASPHGVPPPGWRISGTTDWTSLTVNLNLRTNIVRWTYTKQSGGLGAGWLDDVQFIPRPPQPFSLGVALAPDPLAVRIRFTAEAQRLFTIETSMDLRAWTVLTNVANLSTTLKTITVTPTVDPAQSAKFFRVRAD